MKQELWQLNSAVLALFTLMLITTIITRQSIPDLSKPLPLTLAKSSLSDDYNIAAIYEKDLFDTYIPSTKPSLLSEMPRPRLPEPSYVPERVVEELLEPLDVKLKGILYSADSDKSTALIEDETGQEKSYVVGEKIKDAQVVKITPERVVFFRNNGQQEVMMLKEPGDEIDGHTKITWKNTVKPIDEYSFTVDPIKFQQIVASTGEVFDSLGLLTRYKQGKPVGIVTMQASQSEIGMAIGLEDKDTILSINNIDVSDLTSRYEAFQSIVNSSVGESIEAKVMRNAKEITLTYQLDHIPLETAFERLKLPADAFPKNKDQKRAEKIRNFDRSHPSDRTNVLESIRTRILENMKFREKAARGDQ